MAIKQSFRFFKADIFHFKLLILLSSCCLFNINTAASTTKKVYINNFGINSTQDATQNIISVIQKCKKEKNSVLVFEKGIYHFYPEYGKDKYCFISNNDEGLKRVIFPIEGMNNLTIDGGGSSFIFHGFVNPFVVENSTKITFKNFSIDYQRPFHSEAIIIGNNENELDIKISKDFPYKIKNDVLLFTNGVEQNQPQTTVSKEFIYPYGSLLEFDTHNKETSFMAHDYYLGGTPLVAKNLGENKVRIYLKGIKGNIGNTLVFASANRNYPGFILSDSKDIRFEKVKILHTGGMGIIAQRVHNVTVSECQVIPSNGRMISTTADATHFTNCTGKIELGNCIFSNQMDDATNIHGIYVQIIKKIAPNEVIVQLKHLQQLGFDFLKKGTKIEFVQGKSLITKGYAKVTEVERINKDLTRIKVSQNLPAEIIEGDAIGELREFPDIYIHDNYIGKNRARGMLLNCRGKTIVENNIFHSPGAAILFEGDASYWFEQGGVSDCTIRNNIFDNCLFGIWGKAVIDVAAGISEKREESRYNKNIKIYDNTFKIFDKIFLLHAYGMNGLNWKNNKIEYTKEYPSTRNYSSYFEIENCDNIVIEE